MAQPGAASDLRFHAMVDHHTHIRIAHQDGVEIRQMA